MGFTPAHLDRYQTPTGVLCVGLLFAQCNTRQAYHNANTLYKPRLPLPFREVGRGQAAGRAEKNSLLGPGACPLGKF